MSYGRQGYDSIEKIITDGHRLTRTIPGVHSVRGFGYGIPATQVST
ncbi:hypothetical protein [Enterobacter phage 01_vB_Eclo_IJM]|nr:hypothetical protein [Enterobacter phage 01_vB_Eclo_IJM]